MIRTLGLISMPAFVGMFVLADVFVLTLYGPKWMACVLPLRILIIFAMRRAIGSPATAIYNALGRPDLSFKLGLTILPFYLAGIYVGGVWYGIVGVAVAVTVVRSAFGMVQFKVTGWLLGESLTGLMKPLAPVLGSSIVMGALVWLVRLGLDRVAPHLPPFIELIALSVVGAVIYVALLRVAFHGVRDDVMVLARTINKRLARVLGRVLETRPV